MLKKNLPMKHIVAIVIASFIVLQMSVPVFAGGMFGPPQTLSKKEGGLNTAIGYQYVQDTLKNSVCGLPYRIYCPISGKK